MEGTNDILQLPFPFCQGTSEGNLVLLDGPSSTEGRVEICMGSVAGTVCDDCWNSQCTDFPDVERRQNAQVVCKQLGFAQ